MIRDKEQCILDAEKRKNIHKFCKIYQNSGGGY